MSVYLVFSAECLAIKKPRAWRTTAYLFDFQIFRVADWVIVGAAHTQPEPINPYLKTT